VALFALAAFAWLLPIDAQAQDASPWQKGMHAAVRLLAGSRSGPVLLGGIAVQLDPGWKTYWRTSGDSGVPPRFDFSKSDNVEAVTVLWPAPAKFDDGAGGFSLGYHDQVVLPLRIVLKSNDKPVTLRANINYAVCEKICIPVEASTELTFASVASTEDSVLFAALDTVPPDVFEGRTRTVNENHRLNDLLSRVLRFTILFGCFGRLLLFILLSVRLGYLRLCFWNRLGILRCRLGFDRRSEWD